MTDVLASEWLRLRTLAAAPIALGVLLLALGGTTALSWYAAHTWDGMTTADREHFSVAPMEALIPMVAELCCGILAALAVTVEYSSGTITPTLLAVPGRTRLLAAKALVAAGVSAAAGTVSIIGCSLAGRLVVGARPIHPMTDAASHTPGLLAAHCLMVTVVACVAVGLGVLLRSTAGAIAAVVALVYAIPMFTQALPVPWSTRVSSLLLEALAGEMAGVGNPNSVYGSSLPPWSAGLAAVVYAAFFLIAAAVQIRRRDV
jgi:ABC-2 type transport system permease protein